MQCEEVYPFAQNHWSSLADPGARGSCQAHQLQFVTLASFDKLSNTNDGSPGSWA
jgi:hypothetical protein